MPTLVAFFDLDGTLTSGHIWRGLSRYSRINRVNLHLYYGFMLTHLAQWLLSKLWLVSHERFVRSWASGMTILLREYSREQAQELFYWIVEREARPGFHHEMVETLRQHQRDGHTVVLVSGTFNDLLTMIAEGLGVRYTVGTILEMVNGRYTGHTQGALCFGQEKARRILTFLKREGLEVDLASSYAYADRVYDLPMLELVGHPVVVHPDKPLRRQAIARGWPVVEKKRDGGKER